MPPLQDKRNRETHLVTVSVGGRRLKRCCSCLLGALLLLGSALLVLLALWQLQGGLLSMSDQV